MDGDPVSSMDVVLPREHKMSGSAMETIKNAMVNFFREDEAATAVEYAVMLALIVAVCIGSVNVLANNTGESFDRSAEAIAAAFAN